PAEAALLAAGARLDAQVLKVAHHGSATSTTADWLAAVRPAMAVIGVGADNRYGHPDPGVLERLDAAVVRRTDRDGEIEVLSDGRAWWVVGGGQE
ncbi:MAG: MBL fold metallo-hydrolase, partial [Chloroflexi bacterium CFX6]|nr:MBL fold metallo-hydrolase [Chloroflexi bacterium CFX6]